MKDIDYWNETVTDSLHNAGIGATDEQIKQIAEDISISHEHYGMAFYSPPVSDYFDREIDEWKQKYKTLQKEFEQYQANAEYAVKRAYKVSQDVPISIEKHGEVRRFD